MSRNPFEKELASHLDRMSLPPGAQGEILQVDRERRTVGWAENRPKLQSACSEQGLCLRVIEKGREGLVTTKTVRPERIAHLAKEAIDIARLSEKDENRRFAAPSRKYPEDVPADEQMFNVPIDSLMERLKGIEKSILQFDARIKKVIKLQFSEQRERRGLVSTQAVLLSSESTEATFVVEVLAEQDGEAEVAWNYQQKRFAKAVSLEKISQAAAEHAVGLLGARPLPSGHYPVVFAPRVAAQVLSLVAEALSAEAVQLGRSFLGKALGKAAASPVVNVMDDPALAEGVASTPFDDEGTPHQELALIEDGVLRDYFYDIRSGAREGRESNGHGLKTTLGSRPRPAATNLYLKAGKSSRLDMLRANPKVFFLEDVMGLHMADRITGEFSFGAQGALYEKGERTQAVRGVTIAGSIGQLLKQIDAVGDDLTWYGAMGSPSFLVSSLAIAGA